MIPLWALATLAVSFAASAAGLAVLRRLGKKRALSDAAAALCAAFVSIAAGISFYTEAARSSDGATWRNVGALCFGAFPVLGAVALSLAAQKRGSGRGSVLGTLLGSGLAVAGVGAWVIAYLKGVRGSWTTIEILVSLSSISVTIAAGACLGWWCGRNVRQEVGRADRRAHILGVASMIMTAAAACWISDWAEKGRGLLSLTIVDGDTSEVVPARVTLRHDSGQFAIPDEALPVFSDCGKIPFDNWVPAAATLQAEWGSSRGVRNPFRGSTDFYSSGALTTKLRPGHYRIRVQKGPEYCEVEDGFVISAGKAHRLRLVLRRWSDLPAQGWYSSDDHLHIPRPHPRFDPAIATWMQAEDIHIANLLQMGLARDVHITPQRAFGRRSLYQSGRTLLVGGQENPRTHVLGHSIILGAKSWIDFPQAYLVYERAWREAHRQGALAGYAHWAMAGAQDGLAIWGREQLIDFIEVLNLGLPYYNAWYDALNLGIRVVPTAGTDYPCVSTLPGRERFYAKVNGALTLESWLDAVRRGRTFVTNGPVIEISVDGAGIGDELVLESSRAVKVRARVRFDSTRDRIERLEIVRAGEVVATQQPAGEGDDFAIEVSLPIAASTWLAARASGQRVGERPAASLKPFVRYISSLKRAADKKLLEELNETEKHERPRPSAAHTAPIYIRVDGTPAIAEQPRAREVVKAWLELLDDLEARLTEDRAAGLARFPGSGDGITLEDLRASRNKLLEAIRKTRAHYQEQLVHRGPHSDQR